MQTKSIDTIVREELLNKGFPIHYYMPFLHYALKCLENLSHDFNFGPNVREVMITPESYDRVVIPDTAIDPIDVFGLYGGTRKSFKYNEALSMIYNLEGTTKIPYTEGGGSTMPEYNNAGSSMPLSKVEGSNNYPTVFYPSDNYQYEYNIDLENSEIVLNPGHGLTSVGLRYLASGVSTSTANLAHPYAVPCIISWIDWQHIKYGNYPQSMAALREQAFWNERRKLRSKMSPLSIDEITQILINS